VCITRECAHDRADPYLVDYPRKEKKFISTVFGIIIFILLPGSHLRFPSDIPFWQDGTRWRGGEEESSFEEYNTLLINT
jgi:hypothetical protein